MQPFDVQHSLTGSGSMKISKKHFQQHFTEVTYDFAENTTLNGLKYMAEKKTSLAEKLFWLCTFVLSASLCFLMVYKTYVKWETSGVIITLKEHLVSVNEIPFPAVTICPQARIRQTYYNFTKMAFEYAYANKTNNSNIVPPSDVQKFRTTALFCDTTVEEDNEEDYSKEDYVLRNLVNINTLFEISPKHEDIFDSCAWRNKDDCTKAFLPVLTADGLCFTFNTLAADEIFRNNSVEQQQLYLKTTSHQHAWSLDSNYNSSDQNAYPKRGRGNGANEDLYIVLKEVTDSDFLCESKIQPGFKVYLHHPADLPQSSLHYYSAQPKRTTSFALKLDVLDTSEDITGYDPQIRQCYFPSEKRLQFFEKYTSKNCQLECLTNYTLRSCSCVSYYMPRNNTMSICKADEVPCTTDALDRYAVEEGLNHGNVSQCQCLPSCYDIQYNADVIITKFDKRESDADYSDEDDTADYSVPVKHEYTEIRMYYRQSRIVAMERSELFGLSQFLADCGGTLGLFLGFSFLTLAEIFYFFTIKLCCNFRRDNLAHKNDAIDVKNA